ncbi:unnamed protein product [Orchesella dallaii]|uniref:Methyltransferase domain-containing protein n=1 Tax=Orchesella dallaii TaxID=48710 RepID=A0ABP1S6N1_9HEXA
MWSPKGHAYLVAAGIVSVILIFVFALSSPSKKSPSVTDLAREIQHSPHSQSSAYHNTLLVDYLQPEDFQGTAGDGQQNEAKEKLIQAERTFQAAHEAIKNLNENERKEKKLWELYQPSFPCPSVVEAVGQSGKLICGFELFKVPPRPEECVAYTFGNEDSSSSEFAKEWVSNTECKTLMFHFDTGKYPPFQHENVEAYPKIKVAQKSEGDSKILRSIMKENDHGWIDVMLLDIDGAEYEVLSQILEDFEEVLPFAQIIVKFHINDVPALEKFRKLFETLEKRGLRPYYFNEEAVKNRDSIIGGVMEYSFLNFRGKHLLLVGKNGIVI